MTIGERIKALRKKNDLTQEKLADYLCVSYQAVSKWECGLSSPDLSLIGPLTKLFHVSADELLGLKNDGENIRREELEIQYRETFKTGDLTKRYEVALAAVSEYPGDMKYLEWLSWSEALRSWSLADDKECASEQEKAIKHFACVIENTTDENIKTQAVLGIVQYLCFRGRHEEALQYANLYPENQFVSRDRVLLDCLQGEEKTKHWQKMLNKMLTEILDHIGNYDMVSCEAKEQIIHALIPDGNYLCYSGYLSDIYRRRARIYTESGNYDEAVRCLEKSLEYAIADDEADREHTVYRFTSPFFDRLEYNPDDWYRTGTTKRVEDFREVIGQSPFDRLHHREDFQRLLSD